MTVVTHFAVPVIVAGLFDLGSVKRLGKPLFSRWQMAGIGFCGILPDLLTPHLSLNARYTSWSHTLWFFAAFTLLVTILANVLNRHHRPVLYMCILAVFLHLLCDAVSGGLNPVPPFGHPIGGYWFPARYWLHLDMVSLLAAYSVNLYTRRTLTRIKR